MRGDRPARRASIWTSICSARAKAWSYDSDAPGYLFVRAAGAKALRFTVRGLEAHAGMAPERGLVGDQDRVRGDRRDAPGTNRRRDHRQPRHDPGRPRRQYRSQRGRGPRRGALAQRSAKLERPGRAHDRMLRRTRWPAPAVTVDGKALRRRAGISQRAFLRRDERAGRRADRAQGDRGRAPRWAARSSHMRPAADATPTSSTSAAWWSPTSAPACATFIRCANGSTCAT